MVATNVWQNVPSWFLTIFHSGISAASIVAVALNLFYHHVRPARPARPQDPTYLAAGPAVLVSAADNEVLESGGTLGEEHAHEGAGQPVQAG